MITVSFSTEFDKLAVILGDFGKKQLPFAAALALTRTAQDTRDAITVNLPKTFDRPTPFTRQGIGITTATKETLTATIFVKDVQAEYLRLEELGGTRKPKGQALVLPGGIKLNQYGNIPNKALAKGKASGKVFVATIKGIPGFWQRTQAKGGDKGVKLLARFQKKAEYKPRFGFLTQAEAAITIAFFKHMPAALERAFRSAR